MSLADNFPLKGSCISEPRNAMCCFCGEYAPIASDDFLLLDVTYPDGATQGLWAHGDCLRRAMHPSVPMLAPEED